MKLKFKEPETFQGHTVTEFEFDGDTRWGTVELEAGPTTVVKHGAGEWEIAG